MKKTSELLHPIYERMKEDLLNTPVKVIHSDETTLVISKRSKEDTDRRKSYVYVYASSYYDNQIWIYDFHEARKIDETAVWLKDYQGVICCDNYEGYNKLTKSNPKIKLQKCWSHVRRRYMDIVKNLPEEKRRESVAYKTLEEINKLFKLESGYKERGLLSSEIEKRRKKDSKEIIAKIEEMVFRYTAKEGSALENAIMYARGCWKELFTYIDNGYVEMTNNLAERAVKPFVIARKAFQTSGTYAGARYTTELFSIVQTCRINDVNPEEHIKKTLEEIGKRPVEELTPYYKKTKKN